MQIRQLPPDIARVSGVDLTDAEVLELSAMSSITELTLGGCDSISDESASRLADMQSLEFLDLSLCNQLTDRSIAELGRLKRLRVLNLRWCYLVTDFSLISLGKSTSLQEIYLSGCEEITDHGVAGLTDCYSLKRLELPEFSNISDVSLSMIANKLSGLEYLKLDHLGAVTDGGVLRLAALQELRSLIIQKCSAVSGSSVDTLRKRLPRCNFELIK